MVGGGGGGGGSEDNIIGGKGGGGGAWSASINLPETSGMKKLRFTIGNGGQPGITAVGTGGGKGGSGYFNGGAGGGAGPGGDPGDVSGAGGGGGGATAVEYSSDGGSTWTWMLIAPGGGGGGGAGSSTYVAKGGSKNGNATPFELASYLVSSAADSPSDGRDGDGSQNFITRFNNTLSSYTYDAGGAGGGGAPRALSYNAELGNGGVLESEISFLPENTYHRIKEEIAGTGGNIGAHFWNINAFPVTWWVLDNLKAITTTSNTPGGGGTNGAGGSPGVAGIQGKASFAWTTDLSVIPTAPA